MQQLREQELQQQADGAIKEVEDENAKKVETNDVSPAEVVVVGSEVSEVPKAETDSTTAVEGEDSNDGNVTATPPVVESEQATYASSNNDLKGTKAYNSTDIAGLYTLAMAIVDYRGHRVVAQVGIRVKPKKYSFRPTRQAGGKYSCLLVLANAKSYSLIADQLALDCCFGRVSYQVYYKVTRRTHCSTDL